MPLVELIAVPGMTVQGEHNGTVYRQVTEDGETYDTYIIERLIVDNESAAAWAFTVEGRRLVNNNLTSRNFATQLPDKYHATINLSNAQRFEWPGLTVKVVRAVA